MKTYVVLLLMIVTVAAAIGQKKKNANQPAAGQEATKVANGGANPNPATNATGTPATSNAAQGSANQSQPAGGQAQQQTNPLVNHFLTKFNVAMRFNDPDAARGALYDLIVANPANDSLFLNLALMYYEERKYPSTILVSQELLARNPKNPTALELAASSFEALNIYDKALGHYETLYLQTSAYPTLYKMAFLQFDLKRYKECAATSDILLSKKEANELKVSYPTEDKKTKEYPIKVAVLNLKGLVLIEDGDKAGAKKLFEQALALAPDFAQAKENLAKVK
jgi:tetratricopeptide (TPR) repeat protein